MMIITLIFYILSPIKTLVETIILWEGRTILDTDLIAIYKKQIKEYSLLDEGEVNKLVLAMRKGGLEGEVARQKLIVSNLRLVFFIAKRYRKSHYLFADLIQSGNEALIKAIDNYHPLSRSSLCHYAAVCITGTLLRFISRNPELESLDEEKETSLPSDENVFSDTADNELTGIISQALKTLPKKEGSIIFHRFFQGKTLEDAGRICGMTRQGADQAEARALKRLARNKTLQRVICGE